MIYSPVYTVSADSEKLGTGGLFKTVLAAVEVAVAPSSSVTVNVIV